MRQIFQNYRSGQLVLMDVPVPACGPGQVLVRTIYSAISPGTEMMKVSESKLSLFGKARARPDQVKKVLASIAQQGLLATYKKVTSQLDSLTPLGYSLCGVVVEVGAGVDEFSAGDLVACAGNAHALHAEFNVVPTMLCVRVPDGVASRDAAFTTIAAIALQGLRQAQVALGESVCVVGLGLIGQILVRLLVGTGAKVVGVDIDSERCRGAETAGATATYCPGGESLESFIERVRAITDGHGVDKVIISAGGRSNEPIELAQQLSRDRAKITVVGKTSLNLSWKDFYEKEIEIAFSRSYGPGRYDPVYELGGVDYPIGYVRWTEKRNMACILDMLASKRLELTSLVSSEHEFQYAPDIYEKINASELRGLGFLFKFPENAPMDRLIGGARPAAVALAAPRVRREPIAKVRIGVIGAGNYASSMLLPHLKSRADVELVEVATTTAVSSTNARRRFGFGRMSTDSAGLIAATDIDLVIIATRHSSHAALTAAALQAGKAVFVEKPLALNETELAQIEAVIAASGNDRVTVGFNRRYSPLLRKLRAAWGANRPGESFSYRINAGRLGATSWYGDREKEGTRFEGEGGHFIDTASWWFGSDPIDVSARRIGDDVDNLIVTLTYANGVATISYLVDGDPRFPKERIEVFGGGCVATMDNFRRGEFWASRSKVFRAGLRGPDKGQAVEIAELIDAVKAGRSMPIPIASLIATTRATIAASNAPRSLRALE
jgi:predicted dehydrogenase/threonine dehydrogenase-like Zn-dependent dehydrogenase